MNFHYIKSLLKHYIQATLIDVLHSPFVFTLYQNSIKKQKNEDAFIGIENLRKNLIYDTSSIDFIELGGGSNFNTSKKMRVSNIAKHHAKPKRIAQILYYISKNNNCKNSIELGTSLGISTAYLALAHKEISMQQPIKFISIEGNTAIKEKAEANLKELGLNKYVENKLGNFDEVLHGILNEFKQLDLAFIDGNHRKEATLNYFNQMLPLAHNNSVFIFDDIYWSRGMTEAWNEIKAHPQVTVTVDLFFIGLVFFRQEQSKQHFRLRVM